MFLRNWNSSYSMRWRASRTSPISVTMMPVRSRSRVVVSMVQLVPMAGMFSLWDSVRLPGLVSAARTSSLKSRSTCRRETRPSASDMTQRPVDMYPPSWGRSSCCDSWLMAVGSDSARDARSSFMASRASESPFWRKTNLVGNWLVEASSSLAASSLRTLTSLACWEMKMTPK